MAGRPSDRLTDRQGPPRLDDADWRRKRAALGRVGLVGLRNRLVIGGLWCLGLADRGRRNALTPILTVTTIPVEGLPPAFEGYRILHLSDFHIGRGPSASDALPELLDGLAVDLIAMTGDFPKTWVADLARAEHLLDRILGVVSARDGAFAVPGNYDRPAVADTLARLEIDLLVDESRTIRRGGETLEILGTDDPYSRDTPAARALLASPAPHFRLVLAHTPELADEAAEGGAALYLAGHTHGGQICLPNERPMITNLRRRRDLARGLWREGTMRGYTTTGLGTSGLDVRYNCPPEAAVITLVRDPPA